MGERGKEGDQRTRIFGGGEEDNWDDEGKKKSYLLGSNSIRTLNVSVAPENT